MARRIRRRPAACAARRYGRAMAAALNHGPPVGVVLAGGLGRRLGGDKAIVELEGRPLVRYPVEALHELCDDVVVVAKRDTMLPPLAGAAELWIEPDEPRHPLTGVAHALRLAARPRDPGRGRRPAADGRRDAAPDRAGRSGRRGRRRAAGPRPAAAAVRALHAARAAGPGGLRSRRAGDRRRRGPGDLRGGSRRTRRRSTTSTGPRICCRCRRCAGASPALAADGAHRARGLDEARLVDVVLELLAPDRVADDLLEVVVGRARAQRARAGRSR